MATNDRSRNKVQQKLLRLQLYLEYVLYNILKVYPSENSGTLSNLPIFDLAFHIAIRANNVIPLYVVVVGVTFYGNIFFCFGA